MHLLIIKIDDIKFKNIKTFQKLFIYKNNNNKYLISDILIKRVNFTLINQF